MDWSKATIAEVIELCEQRVRFGQGVTVSAKWLLRVLKEYPDGCTIPPEWKSDVPSLPDNLFNKEPDNGKAKDDNDQEEGNEEADEAYPGAPGRS